MRRSYSWVFFLHLTGFGGSDGADIGAVVGVGTEFGLGVVVGVEGSSLAVEFGGWKVLAGIGLVALGLGEVEADGLVGFTAVLAFVLRGGLGLVLGGGFGAGFWVLA